MIIEKRDAPMLMGFEDIKEGECFEIAWWVNPIVGCDPETVLLKVPLLWHYEGHSRLEPRNAIDLKTGIAFFIENDDPVIRSAKTKIIVE